MQRLLICAIAITFSAAAARAQTADAGKRAYQARCVGCHGEDGSGGGHGPAIVDLPRPRAVTRDELRRLILNGIPDRGMPAFKMPDAEADAIAAYVITFKRPAATAAVVAAPGDAAAGER